MTQAENKKLRLMLQLSSGDEIPAEEIAELAETEQKLAGPKKAKGTNIIETEDVYENIVKPEDKLQSEIKRHKEGAGDAADMLLAEPNSNDRNDLMLAQFLRENEIVEQIQDTGNDNNNEYGDDEEGIAVYEKHKRRDSF